MNHSSSIPWRCHVCNTEHPVGAGGICQRCKRFACNRHLETVVTGDGKEISVCATCLKPDDQRKSSPGRLFRKLFGRLPR